MAEIIFRKKVQLTALSVRLLVILGGLVLVAGPLAAQQRHNDNVVMKTWPAPLFWQPNQAETMAASSNGRGKAIGVKDELPAFSSSSVTTDSIPVGALVFVAMTPCRIVDTRAASGFSGSFGPPDLTGGATRTFPILSNSTCPIPAIAQAYSFNVTVVPFGPLIYLTMWPTGQPQPVVSTLNAPLGNIVANAAVIAAGLGGSVNVYASQDTKDFPVQYVHGEL